MLCLPWYRPAVTDLRKWQHIFGQARGCIVAVVLCAGAATQVWGQDPTSGSSAPVARLSVLDGAAEVTTAGQNAEPVDAAVNMPIQAGQSLHTGAKADAEVEFSDGSVLRSSENSAATVIRLQPGTEIGLDDGLFYLELRAGTDTQFAVYAGDLTIAPTENASFRVRVQNGQPEIAVLRGAVSVTRAESYTVDLRQGESLRPDPKDGRRYLLAETVSAEAGDTWNESLDRQAADAAANQTIARQDYAGQQGYGWSDLDSSGAWYPLPGDGLVWQPIGIDASFDPYGYGSWVYGAGGSYVWASGYSWGWLPYRCGSWGFHSGFGWGWQPALGCRSYGGGWPVGGLPIKHPPHGWRGPRPPASGGIVTRHPTLPVAPPEGAGTLGHLIASGRRPVRPVTVNGVQLRPLAPVATAAIPRGSSAVGSALRRDYPLQSGTEIPLYGVERAASAILPSRSIAWHAPAPHTGRAEAATPLPGAAQGLAGGPAGSAALSGAQPGDPATVPGWHRRILPASGETNRSLPSTPIRVGPATVRPVPAASLPLAPAMPGNRVPSIAPRPVIVAPAPHPMMPPSAPRVVSPPPAPRVTMPAPSAPVMRSGPPSSPGPVRSR